MRTAEIYQGRGRALAELAARLSERGARRRIAREEAAQAQAERNATRAAGGRVPVQRGRYLKRRECPWCAASFTSRDPRRVYCALACNQRARDWRRNLRKTGLPRLWLRVGRIMLGAVTL